MQSYYKKVSKQWLNLKFSLIVGDSLVQTFFKSKIFVIKLNQRCIDVFYVKFDRIIKKSYEILKVVSLFTIDKQIRIRYSKLSFFFND